MRLVLAGNNFPTALNLPPSPALQRTDPSHTPDHGELPEQAADATHALQVGRGRVGGLGAQQRCQRLHRALQQRVQQLRLLLVLAQLQAGGQRA